MPRKKRKSVKDSSVPKKPKLPELEVKQFAGLSNPRINRMTGLIAGGRYWAGFPSDPRIQEMLSKQIDPTPDNLAWAFEYDVTIQAIAALISYSILAGSWEIQVDEKYGEPTRKRAKEVLKSMLGRRRVNFEEFVETTIDNLIKFGNAVFKWRIADIEETLLQEPSGKEDVSIEPETEEMELPGLALTDEERAARHRRIFGTDELPPRGAGLGREAQGRIKKNNREGITALELVDWQTIGNVFKHPIEGYVVLVQDCYAPDVDELPSLEDEPETRGEEATPLEEFYANQTFITLHQKHYVKAFKSDDVIFLKNRSSGYEVGRSPIAPVLNDVVYKKMVKLYVAIYGEKFTLPVKIAKIGAGLPPDHFPTKPQEIKEFNERAKNLMSTLHDLGETSNELIIPPDVEVTIPSPPAAMPNFKEMIDIYDRKIVLSVLGSMYLFEARGVELATSRTIKDIFDRVVSAMGEKISTELERKIFPVELQLAGLDSSIEASIVIKPAKLWTVAEAIGLVESGILSPPTIREEYGYTEEEKGERVPEEPPATPDWLRDIGRKPAVKMPTEQRPETDLPEKARGAISKPAIEKPMEKESDG